MGLEIKLNFKVHTWKILLYELFFINFSFITLYLSPRKTKVYEF